MGAIFDGLAHLISYFEIPPKFYDPTVEEYNPILYEVDKAISQFTPSDIIAKEVIKKSGIKTEKNVTPEHLTFAFKVGLWNGLVENVKGIPELASLQYKGMQFLYDGDFRKELIDKFDEWIEKCNFPKERIVRMGESENWWSAGPTGSCGPCSEIHVDLGVQYGGDENSKIGDEGTDNRFIEIWNLVFTEWNRMEDGSLEPLPKKNIDTGAGLERIAAVVQGKPNNFETDLLFPILEEAARITGSQYGKNSETNFSLKVITDHARAVTFLVNDGVIPSNEGRGYILRRILRRAVRHGRLLGYKDLFMYKMVDKVVERFEVAYPDLKKNLENVLRFHLKIMKN